MATTSHRSPPGTFPFRQLPPGIRLMIYPYELILQLNKQPPALLVALGIDAVLHAKMRSVYLKMNESVKASTIRGSNKPLPKASRSGIYSYIGTQQCNTDGDRPSKPLQGYAQVHVHNNLETVTIDNTAGRNSGGEIAWTIKSLLKQSSRMRKIVVRGVDRDPRDYSLFRKIEWKFMFRHAVDCRPDGSLWVWEIGEGREWGREWKAQKAPSGLRRFMSGWYQRLTLSPELANV